MKQAKDNLRLKGQRHGVKLFGRFNQYNRNNTYVNLNSIQLYIPFCLKSFQSLPKLCLMLIHDSVTKDLFLYFVGIQLYPVSPYAALYIKNTPQYRNGKVAKVLNRSNVTQTRSAMQFFIMSGRYCEQKFILKSKPDFILTKSLIPINVN